LDQIRDSLVRMKEKSLGLETKMSRMDLESLPPVNKGDLVGMRTSIIELGRSIDDAIDLLDEVC